MRIGIAIDVSTDVSDAFVAEHGVQVLPGSIRFGTRQAVYGRDAAHARAFYAEYGGLKGLDAETAPLSVRDIEELFLRKLVVDYDYVFLITLARSRSETWENAHKAAFAILQSYAPIRREHHIEGPFGIRVVDSQSLCTGPGVLAWEAARLVRHGHTPQDIRLQLDDLVPYVNAYLVPRDLYYIRRRATHRGDYAVSLFAFLLGQTLRIKPIIQATRGQTRAVARPRRFAQAAERLFQHTVQRMEAGLLVPLVNVSYGGELAQLRALPGFEALERAAERYRVELMLSTMAPATAVNVGTGALSLAYCGDAGEFALD